jgi:hypothetical protein
MKLYDEATLDSIWWHKVEPLIGRFRQAYTQYYQPSDFVTIDESMIRCFGRSLHIYNILGRALFCHECKISSLILSYSPIFLGT